MTDPLHCVTYPVLYDACVAADARKPDHVVYLTQHRSLWTIQPTYWKGLYTIRRSVEGGYRLLEYGTTQPTPSSIKMDERYLEMVNTK